MRRVLADTHVHFYKGYSFDLFIRSALENFRTDGSTISDIRILFLMAGSSGSLPFDELIAMNQGPTWSYEELKDVRGLKVTGAEGQSIYLIDGRQFISMERLEILAPVYNGEQLEGKEVEQIVSAVRDAGGVAILPWSPGKWSGSRGEIIARLLERFKPSELLLGDISMRPRGAPQPKLFQMAQERGFRIVAGSDPLPLAGEEGMVGSYFSFFNVGAEFELNLAAVRDLVSGAKFENLGQRNSMLRAAGRWSRHFFSKGR